MPYYLKRAYLIFEDKPHWYLRWMKPGFRHVGIALEVDKDHYLLLSHSWGNTHNAVLSRKDMSKLRGDELHLEVDVPPFDPDDKRINFPVFTCTQMVKSLLNIHDWRVQTPHQLVRKIVDGWSSESNCRRVQAQETQDAGAAEAQGSG